MGLCKSDLNIQHLLPFHITIGYSEHSDSHVTFLLFCADNLKLTFPIAAAALQIAWGVASLPTSASLDDQVYQQLRWAGDYLLACRLTPDTLVSQVVSSRLVRLSYPRSAHQIPHCTCLICQATVQQRTFDLVLCFRWGIWTWN